MNDRILVTYASRTGSTVGVAEAIGRTLAEGGAQVDVLPMQDVTDLALYRAVIAGSAIQNKQWLRKPCSLYVSIGRNCRGNRSPPSWCA